MPRGTVLHGPANGKALPECVHQAMQGAGLGRGDTGIFRQGAERVKAQKWSTAEHSH